ncbi:MAG: DNA cytosine methyltransferase [Spirulina sp.]
MQTHPYQFSVFPLRHKQGNPTNEYSNRAVAEPSRGAGLGAVVRQSMVQGQGQKTNWFDAISDLFPRMPKVRLSDRDWQKYGTWLQKHRIGLLDHDGAGSSAVPRCKNFPAKTVRAMGGDRHCWQFTAAVNDKCYRLTPRAIARLQSFSDSIVLPDDWVEACKRIGNAVPPLLIHKLFGDFVRESNLTGNAFQKLNSIQNLPTQNSKFQPVEV